MNDIVKVLLLYPNGKRQVKETEINKCRLFGCKLNHQRPIKILVPPGLSKKMHHFLKHVADPYILGPKVTEYF